MSISKEKFVRDIMRGLQERESDRKEREAFAMIDEPCGYYANKHYPSGKKATKRAYQC